MINKIDSLVQVLLQNMLRQDSNQEPVINIGIQKPAKILVSNSLQLILVSKSLQNQQTSFLSLSRSKVVFRSTMKTNAVNCKAKR